MGGIIRRDDFKKLNDTKLLQLTKRVHELFDEGLVDEKPLHYFINEVSSRKYGYEDVMSTTWGGEFLCFSNGGITFEKMVKWDTTTKFFKSNKGNVIMPVVGIKEITDDGLGNILIFGEKKVRK